MSTWETKWLMEGASDVESISGDEIREPRRRNRPSDLKSREIEDHVLTGHACFLSWCVAGVQGARSSRETPVRRV